MSKSSHYSGETAYRNNSKLVHKNQSIFRTVSSRRPIVKSQLQCNFVATSGLLLIIK